ncbi:MAG: hypothetical protein EOO04_39670, partial [Chitinophagaceae bacterium]
MRKLLVVLTGFMLFVSCNKRDVHTKIEICHFDGKKGKSQTITINANAWPAHQAHGDIPGSCSAPLVTKICDQVWTVKNLDVTTYRNGDPIPQVTDPNAWATARTGAWCYYDNDPSNGAIYGKLYNWYAVNDARGLAPAGWHVPSDAEWNTLTA